MRIFCASAATAATCAALEAACCLLLLGLQLIRRDFRRLLFQVFAVLVTGGFAVGAFSARALAAQAGRTDRPASVHQAGLSDQEVAVQAKAGVLFPDALVADFIAFDGVSAPYSWSATRAVDVTSSMTAPSWLTFTKYSAAALRSRLLRNTTVSPEKDLFQHAAVADFEQLDEAGFHPLRIVLGKYLAPEGDIEFFHPVLPRLSNYGALLIVALL